MRRFYLLLLFSGIVLRFIIQFIYPTFNVDEISLGNNIKYSDFIDLLYPLQYGQSSPPLYLWLQKLIITVSPLSFWINIKVLSFISSILGLMLFYLFIKKNDHKISLLLPFIILLFNPFNINNSLTVKQYTIDLVGILFLLVYFKSGWFKRYNWIFFIIWCLMSNVGLFTCVAYLIYDFINQKKAIRFTNIINYIKENILTIVAPLTYVIYFIWYMKQKGALEMKAFMVNYWYDSFIPINSNIFKYLIYTFHSLWIFLFNAFEFWGIFLMLLTIPFYIFLKRKETLFKQEIQLLFYVLAIHLLLNILHLYPFSDRLYLYLSPIYILILGSSISAISKNRKIEKYFLTLNIFISVITMFLYSLYIPSNDNDIVRLYTRLDALQTNAFYLTEKSMNCVDSFNDFTDNKFQHKNNFIIIDSTLEKSKYLISRVSKKIKMNVTAPEEIGVQNLIKKKKINKIDAVNGYNIYEIIKNK
jgi:hypothetical protein